MKKIILLNSPPRGGKDYAAKHIVKTLGERARLDKFARILKERTHALYGFPERAWDYYESCKDIPSDDFLGLTPRKGYIGVSEKYFKPIHNNRVFGELLLRDIKDLDFDFLVISDSGFTEEAEVLIEYYGAENILLVRIHRDDHDFTNDSRSYLELPVKSIDISNNGDSSFEEEVLHVVDEFINGPKTPPETRLSKLLKNIRYFMEV